MQIDNKNIKQVITEMIFNQCGVIPSITKSKYEVEDGNEAYRIYNQSTSMGVYVSYKYKSIQHTSVETLNIYDYVKMRKNKIPDMKYGKVDCNTLNLLIYAYYCFIQNEDDNDSHDKEFITDTRKL